MSLASCVPLTGLAFPIIEELYFRGFLLPRLSRLGRWAPVVNAAVTGSSRSGRGSAGRSS
ncbi:CPBP family glutamic-type intramembrane protease [Nonomuraea guangzhouensis]|uniref:Type II CAAX prenyl endopeptidase Rce1 family protein n=1 Tax=Nonomuraea guangzhouensis TaxID=1291555 RepID=A0ABW4G398_9ACTN